MLKHIINNRMQALVVVSVAILILGAFPAVAQTVEKSSSTTLHRALSVSDPAFFENRDAFGAFTLSSGFFSGRASGRDPLTGVDRTAELEGDQRVAALMIGGSYDFGPFSSWSPNIGGGVGMALYGPASTNLALSRAPNGDMVPLFRIGGGVTYRLNEKLDFSFDYKAGFEGAALAGDQLFTGRDHSSPIDLHVLNMGLKAKF